MDFEEFVTLLGPKLTAAGMPDKFNGTDFDSVFWKVLIIHYRLYFLLIREKTDREVMKLQSTETQRFSKCHVLKVINKRVLIRERVG